MKNNKILAVASIGGHWVQLLRIAKGLEENCEVVYMSTHEKCATMVEGHRFYKLQDFSRWDAYKLFPAFFKALKLVMKEKPDVVITTGAAPGLVVLIAAKCCGKRTVWIDSIANVNHLSLCGRIASHFASRIYTQWKELENDKILSIGNVLG
ncbi:MAG: glycosyltransferase [Prevotella sp.]|nr:glycosyltransferase [Prevotella sp.]